MPSIEELLNEAELYMASEPVNDVLEIDAETRQISIPESEIILGVETDERAERKYFHCPKIVGNNIDLSQLQIYVVFQNASNLEDGRDRYHVTDVKTTEDGYITFSWELSAKVTAYMGDVQFGVCAIKTGSDGTKKNVWNTTIATGKCLIGLSADMSESEQQSASDLYTQLITELNKTAIDRTNEYNANASEKVTYATNQIQTVGQNQVINVTNAGTEQIQGVEDKGAKVLASIPETYTDLNASVKVLSEKIRGKAPVIVESITSQSWKPVAVNDSADAPLQGMKLYGKSTQVTTTGKNLFNINNTDNLLNNTIAIGDKIIKQRADTYPMMKISGLTIGDNYVISYNANSEAAIKNTHLLYSLSRDNKPYAQNDEILHQVGNGEKTYNVKIAFKADVSEVYLIGNAISTETIENFQVEKGSVATSYEPYTGGKPSPSTDYPQEIESIGDVEVKVTGKNLFGGKAFADKIVELGGELKGEGTVQIGAGYYMSGKTIFEFPDSSKFYTIILSGGNTSTSAALSNIAILYSGETTSRNLGAFVNGKIVYNTIKGKKPIAIVGFCGNGASIFNYDQCGVFEGDISESDFEPYKEVAETISITNGLPAVAVPEGTTGITYTDQDGQNWIADEIDFARRKYIQRIWRTEFTGNDKWYLYTSSEYAGFLLTQVLPSNMDRREGMCNILQVHTNSSKGIEGVWIGVSGKDIYIHNSSFFDNSLDDKGLSNWKAYLAENPMKLMTYLDNPIETDLTEDQIQAFKSLQTFKPTSIISNDAGAQMDVDYSADTKLYIDKKLKELVPTEIE